MALGPGSIAFVGYNADGNDNIAFVALDPLPAGTVIFFQDNEWNGSAFNTGESAWSWTAASDIPAGTVIRIDNIGSVSATDIAANVGSAAFVDTSNRGLSSGDEIIYAFLGTDASTPTMFLSAIASVSLTNNASLVGTGLTDGVDALSLGVASGADIAVFNGARDNLTSFADYRTAINDPANWVFQDGSGDQSADGNAPDVPFATTPFSVAATGTQSVAIAAGSINVAHAEGNSGSTAFQFTVERSGGTTGNVTFDATIDAASADAADFGGAVSLPIAVQGTILAGNASTTVTVDVAGDTAFEGNESFALTLQSVTNSDSAIATSLGAGITATGMILNDDAPNFIGQVQGDGHISPITGQVVTLTGVVTAVDTNGSRGFYMQDSGDGNAATSDGIFVFLPSGALPTVGHQVQVTGTVAEFTPSGAATGSFSTTELSSVTSVVDQGVGPSVTPVVIGGAGGIVPPTEDLAAGGFFYESLEGMLVTVTSPVAVGPTNGFGETFSVVDNDDDPTNGLNATGLTPRGDLLLTPGADTFGDNNTTGGDYNPERIQIDDDNGILAGFSTPAVDVGATLNDVTGIVRYDFGNYEVIATQAYTVDKVSTLSKETTSLAGTADRLTVAAYNAENLDPADGAARFATIASQIVNNMATPDIIALQEIQDNDGPTDSGTTAADVTLQMIVDAITTAGGPTYAYIDNSFVGDGTNGGEPGGNIRTAFLYRTDRVGFVANSVKTIGADGSAVTASYVDQQTNADNPFYDSRPPLVATFTFNGASVTVVNNHFTSKGGSAPLLGSDQPPLNNGEVQRAAQAQAVNMFVDNLIAASPAAKVVVIGDLNEFPWEEPMQVLTGTASVSNYDVPGADPAQATAMFTPGGTSILTDLQATLPPDQQFDYVFEGNAETLDHIMVTDGLASGAQFDAVRINAEFADQTSDHEPLVAALAIPAFSLSNYVRIGRFDLPEPTRTAAPANSVLAQEVSAVTYNWDTDTLFVVGDGGTSVVQISKTGQLIDSMTLAQGSSPQGTAFFDPEGLAYVGGGKFVMVEERDRQAVQFTYQANTTLTRADTETVKLGTTIGNIGLEGLSYDPTTDGYIFVKEAQPESIFQTNIDFAAGTATNGSPTAEGSTNLFDPALLGLADFADVYALSNVTSLKGHGAEDHLLVLSQESAKIVETDRAGTIYSTLSITSDPGNPLSVVNQQHEGLAMDADGFLYVVSENGGGDFDHPQLWVYAASSVPNQAPTALTLTNQVTSIEENTSTTTRIKVADVVVTDDGLGANDLSVSGADANIFEVDNTGLYIKTGTVLDFETKTTYVVTVTVDDTSTGATPDATADFSLLVTNVTNESGAPTSLYISEVAPWSSGNSPVGADWFEVTNAGSSAVDLTGWKMDDNSASFGSAVALSGITSIAPGESVIFIESSDLATDSAAFRNTWFGTNPPAGLQIGSYAGSGVGLSTGGDQVNLYDSSGTLQTSVSFGVAPAGPFPSFDNAVGLNDATITALSVAGTNGAFVAANDAAEVGSPGTIGSLFISEVAPWSSGSSPVGADWFEVTNTTPFTVDLTGWKMDDSSGSPAAAVALNGISSIAPGEAVIFIETDNLPAARDAFLTNWFGGVAPAGLQIGNYTGSGVGLGTGGDAVNLYDNNNLLRASVAFGASPADPLQTFDNTAGLNNATITQLSTVGTNNAFVAVGHATEIGSPGAIKPLNETGTDADETFTPTPLNDAIDGGAGSDTVTYNIARADATVERSGPGAWTVTTAGGGTDALTDIEVLKFSNGSLFTTNQTPYLTPTQPNVRFVSLLSAGDVAGVKSDGVTPWRMVGVPDGIGAFDNGDGTVTVLVDQELGVTAGVVRESGAVGAFVSRLVIDKATLAIVSASDADSEVYLWNSTTQSYELSTTAMARFCSADLAAVSAFYDAATGLGTQDRIFLNGEESGIEGRPMAHIVTGSDAGKAFEIPALGNASWENLLANPNTGDKTVVIGNEDTTGGQLYLYIGQKQATGTTLEKAGLTNGALYGIKADFASEASVGTPLSGSFSLVALPDETNRTGADLQADSVSAGVTDWLRPEDGAWDTINPSRYYFVTTNSISEPSRLWALDFEDPTDPSKGGTYTALLDGTEGQKMLDNITVSADGTLILQEDVGNNARSGRVWHYDPKTDTLTEIAQHDIARFGDESTPATAPFTQDEESSGVVDVTDLLGDAGTRAFLLTTQAHYPFTGPDAAEVVEGGQLQLMLIDTAVAGTDGNDTLQGTFINETIDGGAGSDTVTYNVARTDATVDQNGVATWTVTTPGGGTDTLTNIEKIQFTDTTLSLQPYTLQILHLYGESGTLGVDTAPIMGAMIDAFRASATNTLVLAEGDTWIPGPWLVAGADPSLNPLLGSTALARPDVAIMNAFGVDASALGNHEFDLGSPIVSGAIAASGAWVGAQFPFITSNLDFSADSALRGLVDTSLGGTATNAFAGQEASAIGGKIAPYAITTINGEKIGIVGATTYDLLTKTSPNGTVPKDDGDPSTSDLEEVAVYIQASIDALRTLGVNKIVMVDQLDTIARNQELAPLVSGIDVMVAGGGHERLGDATDTPGAFNGHNANFVGTYPIVTADKDGNPTLIVTTDTEYTYLGRLEVQFTPDGFVDTSALDPAINGAYAANETTLQAVYGSSQSAADIISTSTTGTAVQAIVNAIDTVVTTKDGTKFGYSNVYLEGDRVFGRAEETNLGDLTADANAAAARAALGGGAMPMVSLKNGGGLRASIGSIDEDGSKIANPVTPGANGNISLLDIENALRFDNRLMVFDTTPQGLSNILNYAASLTPGNGGFPQVGGIRFSYDPDLPTGSQVRDIALYDEDGNFIVAVANDGVLESGAPATIPVVILNFTANGGDGYPIKANGTNFRFLLDDGTVSAAIDPSLDFTAAATVPANSLGEQKAMQDYLLARHGTQATAYDTADTPAAQDLRIENLNVVPADAVIPCFAAGTMILTDRGEVAVEDLKVGDTLPTAASGTRLPVIWIGHRHIDCRLHPNPQAVWPVRVAANAFGKGMPARDLFLSPDHAIYAEQVLIPVKYLANGTTIAQVEVDEVTYFHVELSRHEVILAENLAVESYLDGGDRSNFTNGGEVVRLFADFSGNMAQAWRWEAFGYAPLRIVGTEVEATRRHLAKRAASTGRSRTRKRRKAA